MYLYLYYYNLCIAVIPKMNNKSSILRIKTIIAEKVFFFIIELDLPLYKKYYNII